MKTIKLDTDTAPSYVQLPQLHSIPASHPYTDGEWGWHQISELYQCIEQIILSQGCKNHSKSITSHNLLSFTPTNDQFTWITESMFGNSPMEMNIGKIDECMDAQQLSWQKKRMFVPARWGIGVAKTVKEFGVVQITHFNPSGTAWGRRWNGEHFYLAKHDQFWRR